MADELIRLDTTIIGIDSLINKAPTAEEAKVLFTVKDVIYSQQRYVMDVQPVKHGRWITKSDVFYIAWQESGRRWEDMPYFATGLNFACSNCFEKFDVNAEGVEKWNGCPLCLARMDGDAE